MFMFDTFILILITIPVEYTITWAIWLYISTFMLIMDWLDRRAWYLEDQNRNISQQILIPNAAAQKFLRDNIR